MRVTTVVIIGNVCTCTRINRDTFSGAVDGIGSIDKSTCGKVLNVYQGNRDSLNSLPNSLELATFERLASNGRYV